MGEVYRARDTRLDRTVAIKVLSKVSPVLRERFNREARTISSLSHPHICSLFDVGHQDGVDYLVMEFLEGESLADRLARGPMPIDQVMRYGTQIADALDVAHKQGVVHRDLKPGNVILTKSGAKLLDFGLAKSLAEEVPGGSTVQRPLTEEGTVLGTVQYMAPEQLEGREADARTDIFALGATLYEMATGKRAFQGQSRASLIASILDREPSPISQVQPLTPPAFERVVRVCMAKDPDDRWQSAHDVAAELRWIAEGASSAEVARATRGIPRKMLWGLGGLIAGLAIGGAGIWMSMRDRTAVAPVARFAIPLPPNAQFSFGNHVGLAISPDGTRFIYAARNADNTQLYLRTLGQTGVVPIAGTENAFTAAFSPDGRSIAIGAADGLKKLSLDGGVALKLAETNQPTLGIQWFGGYIYYVRGFSLGVWRVPEDGGTPQLVLKPEPEKGARALVWPQMLPDGKNILVTVWNNGAWETAKIVAYPIGGGEPKTIIDGGTCARYVPSGHLLYGSRGSLYAVPFDPVALRTTGSAVPVVNGVASGSLNGEVHYTVSDNGTLVYAPGGILEDKRSLLWIDRHGKEQPVVATKRPYSSPRISPDGRTIAVTLETATFDIWQLDIERDTMTRVSFGGDDSRPVWTPDGRRIIWSSTRGGHDNLYWAAADNSGAEERLTSSSNDQFSDEASPDGKFVAMTEEAPNRTDIALVALSGDHKTESFLTSPRFNEKGLTFSPDGKWIAYISDESGHDEAYLRPFASQGGKWQISTTGANECRWTRNAHELTFRSGTKLYSVSVETTPAVRIGKPQFIYEDPTRSGPWKIWDFSLDNQRILWVKSETPPTAPELQIVLNWFPELKQRAPKR